jgi:hypothetical protein
MMTVVRLLSSRYKVLRMIVLVGICIWNSSLSANALVRTGQSPTGCSEINKEYPFPDQPDKAAGNRIIRAEIELDETTRVSVSERADSSDAENYDSEVVVIDGGKKHIYEVPQLIQNGRALRLLRVRAICSDGAKKTLILGFESGWTGARQAFLVVAFSGDTVNAFGTKVLHQGKLVLDKTHPDHFELWSASPKDDGLCGACAKHYVVYDCEADRDAVTCKQRPRLVGPLGPGVVTDQLIEVH